MKFFRHTERGDTIIEVLIAMTVIGLVLAASFGIANRAALTGRSAQDRTEALKLAESQLELLKGHLGQTGFNGPAFSSFCIDPNAANSGAAAVNSTDGRCVNTNGQGGSGLYTVVITETSGTYELAVSWQQINTTAPEPATLLLYYRTGVL